MKLISAVFFSIFPLFAWAQANYLYDAPGYPQDYFRNPLDIPIFLAGNFGECRPGHFHSGVDIKTLGQENLSVHAAADGYISRIKMEKGGFGHGLYITHPNGYTTLYAHLNDFAPTLQKYLREQQYEKKRWDLDLQLSPGQFPVKKGDLIAYSGNTGASTAPHLHFEIRNNKTEHPLNPEMFGLPLIDKIPPIPAEVAIYCDDPGGSKSFYKSLQKLIPLEKRGDTYRPGKQYDTYAFRSLKDTFYLPGRYFGIGVNVDDYMDGSDNTIAFYKARLFFDDSLQTEVTLDDIGYDESRYINAYADYKTKHLQNKWIQCLFMLPGNQLKGIYTHLNENKGRIRLTDFLTHKITLKITDDKDNQSEIEFYVRMSKETIDMGQGRVAAAGTPFYANRTNVFNDSNVSFTLDSRQLYDDIDFDFRATPFAEGYSDKYLIHYPEIPVHHYFDLKIKPNKTVPANLKNKVVMIYSDVKDKDGRAATPVENGWYKASVRNFGFYWLDIDTIPPVIKPLQKNNSNLGKAEQIAFEVKDSATSVRSFSGYLDGKWICFEQHGNIIFYKFDSHCPKGKHKLVFKAEDENGNVRSTTLSFVR